MRKAGRWALALGLLAAPAARPKAARAESIQAARDRVVAETLRYLNIPYLWGGQHPDTGLDCSGFTQLVYSRAGLHLPRVSRDQFNSTSLIPPREVRPGDLLFFAMAHPGTTRVDHVGIYMGRGYFIQASTTHGIHIEPIAKPYYQERLVAIRKYRGF